MKKLTFLLILAALIAFPSCSSGSKPIDTENNNRVEAPDDPDTQKRPSNTSAPDEDENETSDTKKDDTKKPSDTDKPISDTPDLADPTDSSSDSASSEKPSVTTKPSTKPITSDKVTTTDKEVTPAVPMNYRLEYKVSGGRYLLDADYNLAYVKEGDDPTFHKTSRTKFDDKRTSVYCSDLNKSLLLDKDGNAISAVSGRLEMPYDNFLIAYKSSSSADFRICNVSDGSVMIDTLYSGFNECKSEDEDETANVSLLLGTKQIHIFDGSEITLTRKFEAVYYYVTTYALVREDGHLRLYDTDFELLSDFGEISPANKMHFSDTYFDGKDTFEFFFDSGSFKYEPAPETEKPKEDEGSEATAPVTEAPDTTAKDKETTAETTETSKPETTEKPTSPSDTTAPKDTTTAKPIEKDTSSDSSTSPGKDTSTAKDTEAPVTSDTTGTTKADTDEVITITEAANAKLIESGGSYFLCSADKVFHIEGIKNPIYAEIISANIDLLCILNRDYSVSIYMFDERSIDTVDAGMTEVEVNGDITIINGSIRSYALKDGELLLACSGGFAVSGNWLLGYDMLADGMFAYTLDGKQVVAPENAVDISPLDDGRLLVAQKNRFFVYNANCKLSFLSSTYNEVYMTINDFFLVNDSNKLTLVGTDGTAAAVIADLSDRTNLRLVTEQSGYDSGELIGSEVYFFTFKGYKNGRASTVEFSFFPETGVVKTTEN